MASGGLWRHRTERYDPLVPAPLPALSIDTTLLKPGLRVAVGLSGGADSVALLRILGERSRELGLVLHAAHLHHGLRGAEADADLDFCRELAHGLGLALHEASVDTAAAALADAGMGKAGETIEEAARRLRYGWFRELMASRVVDAVATAHTLDDQAETVLARFLRGAWTEGLSGIYPVVQFPEGPILRPLLSASRTQIEAYLQALGQAWREDSSNRNLTFTRNRIRHELLPLLEEWNPRLRVHLSQMAKLARDEEAWWAAELARLDAQIILPGRPVRGGADAPRATASRSKWRGWQSCLPRCSGGSCASPRGDWGRRRTSNRQSWCASWRWRGGRGKNANSPRVCGASEPIANCS